MVVSCAEGASGGEEVIYIPVTASTMKLRSNDLMIGFDLQPEVSGHIWDRLHKTVSMPVEC